MNDNVIPIRAQDETPEDALERAKEHCVGSVIIIGEDEDGSIYLTTTAVAAPDFLLMLEQVKMALLAGELG